MPRMRAKRTKRAVLSDVMGPQIRQRRNWKSFDLMEWNFLRNRMIGLILDGIELVLESFQLF